MATTRIEGLVAVNLSIMSIIIGIIIGMYVVPKIRKAL